MYIPGCIVPQADYRRKSRLQLASLRVENATGTQSILNGSRKHPNRPPQSRPGRRNEGNVPSIPQPVGTWIGKG